MDSIESFVYLGSFFSWNHEAVMLLQGEYSCLK